MLRHLLEIKEVECGRTFLFLTLFQYFWEWNISMYFWVCLQNVGRWEKIYSSAIASECYVSWENTIVLRENANESKGSWGNAILLQENTIECKVCLGYHDAFARECESIEISFIYPLSSIIRLYTFCSVLWMHCLLWRNNYSSHKALQMTNLMQIIYIFKLLNLSVISVSMLTVMPLLDQIYLQHYVIGTEFMSPAKELT